jgi:flagellar FliL protein
MAENEPVEPEQGADLQADADEAADDSGSTSTLLIVLPVALVMAAVGGWLAYSQYPMVDNAAGQVQTLFASSDSTESEPTEYGSFYEIKGLIVNPASSSGARYLMVDVGLESTNAEVIADLETKEVVVRDRMIRLLGERTSDELSDISKRDTIKTELLDSINDVLKDGAIDRLYFTQYVLQ